MSDVTLRATRFSMPLSHPQQQRLSRRGASYPPVDIWQCLESFSGVKTWEVCDWHLMGSDREAANPPYSTQDGPYPKELCHPGHQQCPGWEALPEPRTFFEAPTGPK